MEAIVKRDINIKNKEVAKECYGVFTESIIMNIQDFLVEKYDIDYDTAEETANSVPKNDFIEIVTYYLEQIKNDKFF